MAGQTHDRAFFAWTILPLLLAGAALTAFGFHELAGRADLSHGWRWGTWYLGLFSLLALLAAVLGFWRGPQMAAGLIGLVVALAGGVLLPVLAVALLALSAYALGCLLLRSPGFAATDSLLLGMVVFGTVLGLLVHLPFNSAGTWGVLFAIPLLAGWRHVRALLRLPGRFRLKNAHQYAVQCAIAAAALLHLLVSLMPEIGHDALVTHLFVPAHLAYHQTWNFDVSTYVWAVMPMFVDWLYAAGYLFAGETGARLVNFGGVVLLAALVQRVARWAGADPVSAAWAVLLFLVTPLSFTESSSLFIEAIWSALVVGGTLALLRLLTSSGDASREILLGGVLLGGALAAKAVTLTALPVLALVLVVGYRRWFSPTLLSAAGLGLTAFLAIGSLPYVTAYILTGNPVFPFFNALFQSPLYPPENFSPPAIFERGFTWDTLYRMTFDSGKYLEARPGAAGFQLLLLLVPGVVVLAMTRNRRALVVALVAGGALWLAFGQTAYLRYVFPSFALFCAVVGAFLASLAVVSRWAWRAGILVSTAAVTLNLLHFDAGTHYGKIDFQVIASARARDAYLEDAVPIRAAVDLVNALNRPQTSVAFFSAPLAAGLKAKALYANWYNQRFMTQALAARDANEIGRLLARYDVDYVIVDDAWQHPELRGLVAQATTEIARIGTVSVRRLDDARRSYDELLRDPSFERAGTWQLTAGATLVPGGGVRVTVYSPAYAVVPIEPGARYRYSAAARCDEGPAEGRLQVNWLRANGVVASADIQVFSCTLETTIYRMGVRAPTDATQALVYASGHTAKAVVFSRISFQN